MTTRVGGVSVAPFDSLNLQPKAPLGADQDAPAAVAENQHRFAAALGAQPVWMNQVHGAAVRRLTRADLDADGTFATADAAITTEPGIACAVLVADCLPVLLCSADGAVVGAAHAGWRGLAAGVLEASLAAMRLAGGDAAGEIMAWLGPCIGPAAFEVGADVLQAFGASPDEPGLRFNFSPRPDGSPRWRADLAGLARDRLHAAGITRVSGGGECTVSDPSRFFSFRRDGRTGRMAAAIAVRAG